MLESSNQWPLVLKAVQEKSIPEVAEEFGISAGMLSLALIRANVRRRPVKVSQPSESNRDKIASSKDADSMPQDKLINGLSVRAGTKDALIAAHVHDLGKVPDGEIASRVGVSARTVAAFRRRQGLHLKRGRTPGKAKKSVEPKVLVALPPEKSEAPVDKKFRTRGPASKIDPHVHMLGKVPDRQISKLAGVTVNAVAAYRRRRGISAVGRGGSVSVPAQAVVEAATQAQLTPVPVEAVQVVLAAAPAPVKVAPIKVAPIKVAPIKASPVAKPAVVVASGSAVYRVELADGSIAYAVARGLGEAGSIAEAAGAIALSYLGPVLG
ncbi:MAG: hypothetical protein ACI9MC_001579 [Kiritimatiellia bacterium]